MWSMGKRYKQGRYWVVKVKNHPKRDRFDKILEHRVIIENYIGRMLEYNEFVHHIDNNGHNNSIDNLQVMNQSEHNKLHNSGRRYGKLVQLKCPVCSDVFNKQHCHTHLAPHRNSKRGVTCCSGECNNELRRMFSRGELTDDSPSVINHVMSVFRYRIK